MLRGGGLPAPHERHAERGARGLHQGLPVLFQRRIVEGHEHRPQKIAPHLRVQAPHADAPRVALAVQLAHLKHIHRHAAEHNGVAQRHFEGGKHAAAQGGACTHPLTQAQPVKG